MPDILKQKKATYQTNAEFDMPNRPIIGRHGIGISQKYHNLISIGEDILHHFFRATNL